MQDSSAQWAEYQSHPKPPMLRALQQTATAAGSSQFAYVTTVEELRAALSAGVRHIEITEHLDLTPYEAAPKEFFKVKLTVNNSTWSIRVRSLRPWLSASVCSTGAEEVRSSRAAAPRCCSSKHRRLWLVGPSCQAVARNASQRSQMC
jgi:hypothetical protein